ncbi:hypothetical protein [Brevibacterium casei]|uniref:Uncharacterized protein n=1 Tax=Brevibacterium casei CIP 102111 TaxID=1255625 RepID=A0A2H1JWK5_9MICO|nr:hypothetical protein [Brevibacterium casei]QPR40060.1 hypothetical protein I6G94_04060 [Brevibacterium casei]QPR44224.1 hypothetical protein I6G93_01780 [Brevibacterium casei]SMX91896.1 hypothetical protein BC102111_02670 [Brevibacterium casei CIP 102111]
MSLSAVSVTTLPAPLSVLAATETPSGGPDPDLVTPGTIGFLTTFAIVVVAIFLIRDALKRVRRVRARSRASDAYPIPLRKYAVPNQSTLSGANAPEAVRDDEPGTAVDDGRSPAEVADRDSADDGERPAGETPRPEGTDRS